MLGQAFSIMKHSTDSEFLKWAVFVVVVKIDALDVMFQIGGCGDKLLSMVEVCLKKKSAAQTMSQLLLARCFGAHPHWSCAARKYWETKRVARQTVYSSDLADSRSFLFTLFTFELIAKRPHLHVWYVSFFFINEIWWQRKRRWWWCWWWRRLYEIILISKALLTPFLSNLSNAGAVIYIHSSLLFSSPLSPLLSWIVFLYVPSFVATLLCNKCNKL